MPKVKQFIFKHSFNNKVARHRRRPNIEPMKERFRSAMRIAEVLRSNELIAIPIDAPFTFDQPRTMPINSSELTGSPLDAAALPAVRSRTVPVDFLGRQILLMPGSVKIAQLTGTALLVAVVHRSADWRHQVLEISPPVSLDGDAVTVLQRCVKLLEGPIARNPAYWDWWGDRQDLVDLGLLPAQA
jgi:lauroyl/myristoyl acyltransferase